MYIYKKNKSLELPLKAEIQGEFFRYREIKFSSVLKKDVVI